LANFQPAPSRRLELDQQSKMAFFFSGPRRMTAR
jgi:hypothetical protein